VTEGDTNTQSEGDRRITISLELSNSICWLMTVAPKSPKYRQGILGVKESGIANLPAYSSNPISFTALSKSGTDFCSAAKDP